MSGRPSPCLHRQRPTLPASPGGTGQPCSHPATHTGHPVRRGSDGQATWPFRCLTDRDDLTGRLSEVGCPALIVHGSQDAAIPPARAEQMRDGLAGPVTFTLIDGAPHASNLTHPGVVNAKILRFLGTLAD